MGLYQVARGLKRRLQRDMFRVCEAGLRAAGSAPLPVVFILGHMRSGSTLLLHILLTHPEIIGCGERNTAYFSTADLGRLSIAARISRGELLTPFRYVVDQINHDRFTPNESVLHSPGIRLLFLFREPRGAISSIVNLGRAYYDGWTVEKSAEYYVQRLNTLALYAENLPGSVRSLPLTYRQLVEDTPQTFRRLQDFLGLDAGFSERYDLQPFSGYRGDPSEKIRARRILRGRNSDPVEIPPRELETAWAAYRACQRVLERERPS